MDNKNTLIENADSLYFTEVEDESGMAMELTDSLKSNLVGLIEDRYAGAESARESDEKRWMQAYHNFRGLYPKNVRFRESEKSRVFIKVTKTKVLAAFGQLVDVIFGTGKFPIGVRPTEIPEGVSEYVHIDPTPSLETSLPDEPVQEQEEKTNPFDVGYEGDDRVLKPGATFSGDAMFEEEVKNSDLNIVEGPSPNPQVLEMSPAKEAARQMEKLIHDQVEESSGSSELRNALFESTLFGTGIVKGPFNFNKTLARYETDEEGKRTYKPLSL